MRYYLDQTSKTNNVIFKQRVNGTAYQLLPSATVFWGGKDPFYQYCNCWMQYVRIYLDWVADSADKIMNLALMNPDGKYTFEKIKQCLLSKFYEGILYVFYFASDSSANNNQTFIADIITGTSETRTIGYKGN